MIIVSERYTDPVRQVEDSGLCLFMIDCTESQFWFWQKNTIRGYSDKEKDNIYDDVEIPPGVECFQIYPDIIDFNREGTRLFANIEVVS